MLLLSASSKPLTLVVGALLVTTVSGTRSINVGQLKLHSCVGDASNFGGYCGRVNVSLDRNVPAAVNTVIEVGFEFYPRTETASQSDEKGSLLVFQEGGPGYSTTGSREDYLNAFASLRGKQDVLLMDKRGTGLSSAIDCPDLQTAFEPTLQQYEECSKSLKGTGYFFSSANAAHDLADITARLGYSQIDYYGDSYATWFGQVLATLHPDLIRTMVLDSAYPIRGDTSNSELILGISNLKLVCERAAPGVCPEAGATDRLTALVSALRKETVTGTAPDASGVEVSIKLDPQALVLVIHNAGNGPITYLELDAATRAYLGEAKDARPLLRMVAEARDGYSYAGKTRAYSVGLMMQIICSEQSLLYSINSTLSDRKEQYEQSLLRMEQETPNLFAPFSVREVANAQMNSEFWSACMTWSPPPPGASSPYWWVPAGEPVPAALPVPTNIPLLVLNGELDTVTSRLEAQQVQALFHPGAHYVQVANAIHETAIYSGGPTHQDSARCVTPLVAAFVSSGGRLDSKLVECTKHVRPFRPVPQYARHVHELRAALPTAASAADQIKPEEDLFLLQLASVAVEAVGDAFSRYQVVTDSSGVGLRGGSFTIGDNAEETGALFQLNLVAWTEDSAVSGTVSWNMLSGVVQADVSVQAKTALGAQRDASGQLKIVWTDTETLAVARITGQLDGVAADLQRVAP